MLGLVAQSWPTLCDPMDYSPSGFSVYGDSPDKNIGVGCHVLLQGIFPTQGSNLYLLHLQHWQAGSLLLAPAGMLEITWLHIYQHLSSCSLVAQLVRNPACNAGDLGFIPGLGRSPGEGKGYPLQYSGLENSMDCRVHGAAKISQI